MSERRKIALLSFCLLCCSLLLTAYSARNPSFARLGASLLQEVVAPFNSVLDHTGDAVRGAWDSYLSLVGVAEENSKLRTRITELENERGAIREYQNENQRLRSLMELGATSQLKGVVGEVIGDEPSGWGQGLVINKGSSHGVRAGSAVVHHRGVVGQVITVSPNFSHVLLVTDHASGIDAIVQDSRTRGVVEGLGVSHCELKYVEKQFAVRVGDVILTSGMDGVFPKGLIVGTVSKVAVETGTLLQNVEVNPTVDFRRLEEVLVLTQVPFDARKVEEAKQVTKSQFDGVQRN